jgi:hypothetical protein
MLSITASSFSVYACYFLVTIRLTRTSINCVKEHRIRYKNIYYLHLVYNVETQYAITLHKP